MANCKENFRLLRRYITAFIVVIMFWIFTQSVQAANIDFTAGAWVKPAESAASKAILVKHNEIRLVTDASGRPVCQIHDGTSWQAGATSSQALSLNAWHYVACIYDGSNIKVYMDGAEAASLAESDDVNNTANPWRIGSDAGGTYGDFNGFIDEVKIYPYARTADEIRQDYAAGLAGISSPHGVSASFGGSSDSWMSDGLVGYWQMDESATTSGAVDNSGNGNDGTYYGHASTTGGKYGNGGVFDGTEDYVEFAHDDSLVPGTGEYSVCIWAKVNSSETSYQFFFGKKTIGAWDNAYGLSLNDSGYAEANFEHDGAEYEAFGSTDYRDDAWHHYCATRKTDTVSIFVDGAQEGAIQDPAIASISVGGNSAAAISNFGDINPKYDLNGQVDELRVYRRALSPAEVRKLYEWAPGPVAHWKFDEMNGSTAYDSAASTTFSGGNHGTLMNMATSTNGGWTRGKYGGALSFDGTDDYVLINGSDKLNFSGGNTDQPFSASAWINMNDATVFRAVSRNDSEWVFVTTGGGTPDTLVFGPTDSEGNFIRRQTPALTAYEGEWIHIAGTYDGTGTTSGLKIYVNGIRSDESDWTEGIYTAMPNIVGDILIGRNATSGPYAYTANGLIDDVRIYNYELTQKQVLEAMMGGRPAAKSPVLHLSFDEGYGAAAYDSSIHKNHGTLYPGNSAENTATSAMWSLDGKFGKAIEFDGTDDYVDAGSDDSIDNPWDGGGTASVWVYVKSDGEGNYGRILEKKDTADLYGWQTFVYSEDSYGVKLRLDHTFTSSYYEWYSNTQIIPKNQWTHVVITYNSDSPDNYPAFYINGEAKPVLREGAASGSRQSEDGYPLLIGNRQNLDRTFDGLIDEVKIYNYALTEDEIKTDYNQGVAAVMGSLSTPTAATSSNAASRAYCVPGSDDYCAPPVGEWRFDEKTGATAYDKSGQGNDGTLTWMATSTNGGWRGSGQCQIGNCLEFDGVDDYVNLPITKSIINSDNYAISAWFKTTTLTSQSGPPGGNIYAESNTASNFPLLGFGVTDSGQLEIFQRPDSGSPTVTIKSASVVDGAWHYGVAVRRSATDWELYLNGFIVGTDSDRQGTTTIDRVTIGTLLRPFDHHHFNGLIDDVRVYDYARTPAQIAWDYNRGKPIAHWRFDECSGGTIYDQSGNANHGTLQLGDSGTTATGTCASSSDSFWYNGRSGKYNSAGSFDGVDDYVDAGSDDSIDNPWDGGGTASVWVYVKSDGEGNYGRILEKNDEKGLFGWQTFVYSEDSYGVKLGLDHTFTLSYYEWYSNIQIIPKNQWTHVVITYNSDSPDNYPAFYINGEAKPVLREGDASGSRQSEDGYPLLIGNRQNLDRTFDGLIDEVKIYNYVLTPHQIQVEYNGGVARFGE